MCKMRTRWQVFVSALFLSIIICSDGYAQNVSIKSNLLYDATGTVNLGIETSLCPPHWTFDLSGNLNAWIMPDESLRKHAFVQPELRYWLCDSFAGHFFGLHLHGGIFNIGNLNTDFKFAGTDFSILKDHRFQGWFAGAGVGYGYALPIDVHWNLEFEIGAGYAYSMYDMYECAECGEVIRNNHPHHYFGLTKAAICIAYLF